MYNAEPGSALAKAFKQDYGRFMYWTRRAASLGEPRALFNLAVRLAGPDALGGVQPDPATAYQAFVALEPVIDRYKPQLDGLRPVVDQAKRKLEKELGKKRVHVLRAGAPFTMSSLSPAESEPPLGSGR